jgi:1,4-alpha-glucan branching enzyme
MTTTAVKELVDLRPGAVDDGKGNLIFALYAPGKQSVHVIGDFNRWNRTADPLTPTPEGLWWLEKKLKKGAYAYQFLVDGELVICDPYATTLVDDSAKKLPRALVEVGRKPYAWRHDSWQRPAFNELIIYELHVGDFTPQGTFQGVIEKLSYLRDLGVNALELMPVFEFAGDTGWGYNPAYFFAVEKGYGTPDDFKQLVDQAHAHGIAIILDLVVAHTAHRHPFNKLYPYQDSPWYGRGIGELNQFGFPMLDYTKPATEEFINDVQEFWCQEFHVDGFRYDYLHGIGSDGAHGAPFLVRSARHCKPDAYLIGEYSPEHAHDCNATGLDGAWRVSFSYALKAVAAGGQFQGYSWEDLRHIFSTLNGWEMGYASASRGVNYSESHDEPRTMRTFYENGLDEQVALHRSALAASILFTMPGEPMLYHGQEWGEDAERATNKRNLIHWERLDGSGRQLFAHYRKLAWLRREHPALSAETYSLDAIDDERKCVVYHRWNDHGDEVFVAANFSPEPQTVQLDFFRPGVWREVLSERRCETDGQVEWALDPGTAAIFVRA